MSNPERTGIPDGGVLEPDREEDDGGDDDEFELDVDLPEDSIFDLEDYLKMYEVASKPKQFRIIEALAEDNELSTSELSMVLGEEDNDLHYPLRTLKEVGLIKNRRNPNTGTKRHTRTTSLRTWGGWCSLKVSERGSGYWHAKKRHWKTSTASEPTLPTD
ncbi:winged helix-turn-helix domain-containing protein (plasmid) [Haloarcula sp. NS06]|uniref:winged helix-turn-helix domain-containing protein n=1 Tax=Haloarcula sp. NS06 TaxID=3409688 RepID=UPI003DA79D7D